MTLHPHYLLASVVLSVLFVSANRRTARRGGTTILDAVFRPSQVMIAYVIAFYLFGAAFFWTSNILKEAYLLESLHWTFYPLAVWAIGTALAILLTNLGTTVAPPKGGLVLQGSFSAICAIIGFILVVLHAITEAYPLIVMGFGFFLCAYGNSARPSKWLVILSLIAFAVSLPLASFSKRIIIFPASIVIMLLFQREAISRRSFGVLAGIALIAIIPMSIMRGYGAFAPENFLDAVQYTRQYINNPLFLKFIANNLEFTSFYFHGVNAVEIFSKTNMLLYGETIIRAGVSPLIYFGYLDGLSSSVDIYTKLYDPRFRAVGGSYPVNLFSEIFMNFGVLAVVVYGIVCYCIDALRLKSTRSRYSFVRFASTGGLLFCCLLLARGSSFSLFFYNLIFVIVPIGVAYFFIPLWARNRQVATYPQ